MTRGFHPWVPAHVFAAMLLLLAIWPTCAQSQDPPSSALSPAFFYKLRPETSLWVAPPVWKVTRSGNAPAASQDGIDLYAACNEYEPVQLVSRFGASGNRVLSLGSTWTGPSGNVITATLHNVIFDGSGVPDVLQPVTWGASVPLTVSMNDAFWLTFRVPPGTAPGIYTNTLTFTAPSFSKSFPVRVHVLGFTLPAESSFRATVTWATSGSASNVFDVNRWFFEHRMIPSVPTWPSGFIPQITWVDCAHFYDEGDQPQDFSLRYLANKYLAGAGFNDDVGFASFTAVRYTTTTQPRPSTFCGTSISGDPRGTNYGTATYNQKWGAYLKALQDYCDPAVAFENGGNPLGRDYLSKAHYDVMNEPQNTADYNLAAWLASVSRQYAPKLPLLISEEAKPEIYNNALYPGQGYDIWLGYLPGFAGAMGNAWQRLSGNNEQSWWYMIPETPGNFLHPNQPSRSAVQTRLLTWLAWRHRVSGWYDTGLETPMLSTVLASPTGISPTIRSELLRESIEDYEYFRLANGGFKPKPNSTNPADLFVEQAAQAMTGFEQDPSRLLWLRLQLANYLGGASYQSQLPADSPRPYGSYYFNFQDPAGYPTTNPLVVDGHTWTKQGKTPYDPAQQLGWIFTEPSQLFYGSSPSATGVNELQKSYIYEDFGRRYTFVLGIQDGVYDVAVMMGRPTASTQALAAINGDSVFGDWAANQPETLPANATHTKRVAIRGGRLVLEVGQALPGVLCFIDSLAVTAVSPSSPDGIDDLWQVDHFGSATSPSAAAGFDADGDGMDNAAEYFFGSDPTSASSRLSFTYLSAGPNGGMLEWSSRSGQLYQVEASADLVSWSTFKTVEAGTTPSTLVIVPFTGVPRQFFRVRALAP
ncbi:hypothetical protein [Luteolibacter soli]|uniref:F5/8 type C domain-containing protein n=1 Tax=Luteolibacter soli TaxID=3135280 RepID=A0ABU9AW35_9BACT